MGSKDWPRYWQSVLQALNQTKHSRTGFTPKEVTDKTAGELFTKKYGKYFREPRVGLPLEDPKRDLAVGAAVRILVKKTGFTKGAKPNFSEEVFKIVEKRQTYPTTYLLKDQQNERILELFYRHELLPAETGYQLHRRVRKVHRKRREAEGNKFEVSFQGYPAQFRTWIDEATLKASKKPFV